ncbi:MAG: citrate synthase [Deltaproteobacteria bacterium]|nr:citrate synthase [Deltaproteobacteria bacterium]
MGQCRRNAPGSATFTNSGQEGYPLPKNTITITDNRTGKTYEVPVENDTIRAMDLRQIKVNSDDFGMMTYDPAFTNTASCQSSITFIDGDKGILEYRGIPIQELAEHSTYLEVAYLLVHGKLPTKDELVEWDRNITYHTFVHENVKKFVEGFRHDAHPMGMMISTLGALSTFYPSAKNIHDPVERQLNTYRLIAKMPTLAAWAYRHLLGMPYVYPDNELSFAGNFLAMMFKMAERRYLPHPAVERALDVLFILHADHEQNCSTNTMRSIGSSHADPFSCVAGATAALYGPLHGGANQAVLEMIDKIGSKARVTEFIKGCKDGSNRLMGFGHRVYKNYDPRAKIIKKLANEVFDALGSNPKIEIALEIERIALEDDYFVSRKLYPNVDFYSGLIYEALRIPVDMFTVLFAIPRTAGWIAQWIEMLNDKEQKIARPRQVYTGARGMKFVPLKDRK